MVKIYSFQAGLTNSFRTTYSLAYSNQYQGQKNGYHDRSWKNIEEESSSTTNSGDSRSAEEDDIENDDDEDVSDGEPVKFCYIHQDNLLIVGYTDGSVITFKDDIKISCQK